jgi:flagellar basal-body rod protein FlgC
MSISAFSSAVSGMRAASLRLEAVASNVANAATPGYEPVGVRQQASGGGVQAELVSRSPGASAGVIEGFAAVPAVDLATEMTDMLQASIQYKAGLKVASVASDMSKSTVDLLR